jgi:hypothetical protein
VPSKCIKEVFVEIDLFDWPEPSPIQGSVIYNIDIINSRALYYIIISRSPILYNIAIPRPFELPLISLPYLSILPFSIAELLLSILPGFTRPFTFYKSLYLLYKKDYTYSAQEHTGSARKPMLTAHDSLYL